MKKGDYSDVKEDLSIGAILIFFIICMSIVIGFAYASFLA
jgi:hypothetical protein